MKANYHTHHYLCKHATGNVEDYVKEAIKSDFIELGISDHAPNKRVNDRYVRMDINELPLYLKDIEANQVKYQGKIKILKGLEVEYFYDHEEYYQDLREKVDYLVHGQHYISMTNTMDNLISGFSLTTKEQIDKYASYLEDAMASGYFDIMAHPDLYLHSYKNFDINAEEVARRICKAAVKYDLVLEYNANGYRKKGKMNGNKFVPNYPREAFWKIVKEYNCKTILGSDAHEPKMLYDNTVKKAEEDYLKLGLNNVVFLKLKNHKKG